MSIPGRKLFLTLIIPLLVSSCIRDNYDDCGIYLEFIFDYNMEYADAFHPQVKHVDIFVFNENNHLILHKYAESSDLVNNQQMYLTDDLTSGTYKIVTVGGQSEQIRLITQPDEASDPVTLHQVRLALQRESDYVDFEFPHVWLGETVEINYVHNRAVWPVQLVRNTNKFTLMLQDIDTKDISNIQTPPYTFEIVTPEAGIYGHDNQPLVTKPLTYHPYYLKMVDEPENTSVGLLNTMRLLADKAPDSYQLIIRRTESGEVVWSYDLIQLLKNTKPPLRPDDTQLPLQEYLDRQGEWTIKLLYREIIQEGNQNFIGISIDVNGWIIGLNEIEV